MYFEDVAAKVTPGLIGIINSIAINNVRDAVVEFCSSSWIYEQDLDAITILTDEDTYALSPPVDTEIISVPYVKDENDSFVDFSVDPDFSQIILSSIPSVSLDIVPHAVLIPTDDSKDFPDFMWARYRRELIAGARALCFEMPGRPWTDHAAAELQRKIFKKGITRAKIARAESRIGSSRVEMRVW